MRPTSAQVWKSAKSDPGLRESMPPGSTIRLAMRPFIEGSVDALKKYLDEQVTLRTLLASKLAFIRFCLEHDFGRIVSEHLELEEDELTNLFRGLVDILEQLLANVSGFLEEQGVSEEDIMQGQQVGFNPDCQEKWKAGTLTIGEVLVLQPSVIINNK